MAELKVRDTGSWLGGVGRGDSETAVTHACGHNASRRVNIDTTSATPHHHERTAPSYDDDGGQRSRYLARGSTRPRLVFRDSPSSEGALRGGQIALGCDSVAPLGCDFVAPSMAQVGQGMHNLLWSLLFRSYTTLHGWPCGSEKDRVLYRRVVTCCDHTRAFLGFVSSVSCTINLKCPPNMLQVLSLVSSQVCSCYSCSNCSSLTSSLTFPISFSG